MQADTVDSHRSAVLIVGRIRVVLQIKGRVETGEEPRGVVALPQIFRSVIQAAIANQEIKTSGGQILLMKP